MLFSIFTMFMLIFFMGLYSFFLKSNHFLNMLLSLEFLSLIIFIVLFLILYSSTEKFILMYYITFCVCEGALGLSLLVSLVRLVGNDYLNNLSFLKC
uniref:NADH-ubiquinone oxidoreductase chain 4L n=1 Tax=Kilauella sp. KispEL TaxID=1940902 RepID=A0A8K1ZFR9_9NEOP|nr:NADH dehydrogenase subunit 4L [Kilauella sp. KispEL]